MRQLAHYGTLSQGLGESETEFGLRINNAVTRCENVHPSYEKMKIFISGLHPTIRSLVARFRDETPRRELNYELLAHFA